MYFFVLFLLIVTIFIFSILFFEKKTKHLKIIFLDVGQGDAIFIEAPNGNKILVDGGPTAAVVRELSKFLPFYDKKINLLLSSHSDSDHIGGSPEIFKRFEIEKYATSAKNDSAILYIELEKLNEVEKSDRFSVGSGDRIILDEKRNIYLDILWPIDPNSDEDNNDASVVLKLVFNNKSFLLTGDASTKSETEIINYLLDNNFDFKTTVLKVGHHGSKTSTSEEFLNKVSPEYAVISVGEDNKFNHPSPEIISLLSTKKIKILETSIFGSIIFTTDGENLWIETTKNTEKLPI